MSMIKKHGALILCVILGMVSLTGCSNNQEIPTISSSVSVETQYVTVGDINLSENFVGTMSPKEITYVFSSMSGIVDKINVEEGDMIVQGDILFTLDNQAQTLSLDQANATYGQVKASKEQALLMANLDVENTLSSYNQLTLARSQAITQAENAITNTNASYEHLVLAHEQSVLQAENTIKDAYANYNQLVATREQAIGATVDMQLLELEIQMDTLRTNIETAKLQLIHAGNTLDELSNTLADAKDDYKGAVSDLNIADKKLSNAYDDYAEAQIKVATAQSLAESYATIQASSTTLSALQIQDAIYYGISDGIPEVLVNSVYTIYTEMKSAGIRGLSLSDIADLSREASELAYDYALAQTDYTEARTIEAQNEAIKDQLEDGYETAEIELDNAQELTYATITGLEINLKALQEIYDTISSDATNEAVAVYDAYIELAQLGIMQAEQALDMINDNFAQQILQAQLGVDQVNEALNMTIDSYDGQLDQLNIALNATQVNVPAIESVYNAQLSNANVGIALATYVLDELIVVAPTNGIVDNVYIKEQTPISNSEIAITLCDYSKMQSTFYVSYDIKNTLEMGQQVIVEYEGIQYIGEISEIATNMNAYTSLFEIKVLVEVEHGTIPTGVTSKIYTPTQKLQDNIVIPYSAINYEQGNAFVYIVKDGIAYKQYVETGLFNKEIIAILRGLNIGDEIITTWNSQLRDGAIIRDGE